MDGPHRQARLDEGRGSHKQAEEQGAENLRVERGGSQTANERSTGKRSALRTQQCPRSVWQPGPNCGSEKVCIHWLRCQVLPTMLRGGGVVVIEQGGWFEASCEVIPRGWCKPCVNQNLASSDHPFQVEPKTEAL